MNTLEKFIASATPYIKLPHIRCVGGQWLCSHRGTHIGLGRGETPHEAYYAWDQKRQGSRNTHA